MAVDLWSGSGLSAAEFCRREGLAASSLFAWQRRLRNEHGDANTVATSPTGVASPPQATDGQASAAKKPAQRCARRKLLVDAGSLLPVRVVEDTTADAPSVTSPIEIIFRRGVRIRVMSGCDLRLLRRVVKALEGPPC
jgi:transposase-like protein